MRRLCEFDCRWVEGQPCFLNTPATRYPISVESQITWRTSGEVICKFAGTLILGEDGVVVAPFNAFGVSPWCLLGVWSEYVNLHHYFKRLGTGRGENLHHWSIPVVNAMKLQYYKADFPPNFVYQSQLGLSEAQSLTLYLICTIGSFSILICGTSQWFSG